MLSEAEIQSTIMIFRKFNLQITRALIKAASFQELSLDEIRIMAIAERANARFDRMKNGKLNED